MLLIIGRTASGKDTLAQKLTEHGLVQLKSYTTRDKRYEEEDTHLFVTNAEMDAMDPKSIVAKTTIGDATYFATNEQVRNSDIYVIDPPGALELAANCPDENFQIIYVSASDDVRRARFINRATEGGDVDENEALLAFEKRDAAESARFTSFEVMMANISDLPKNIGAVITLATDDPMLSLNATAESLSNMHKFGCAINALLEHALDIGALEGNSDIRTITLEVSEQNTPDALIHRTERIPFWVNSALANPSALASIIYQTYISDAWQETHVKKH